MAFQIKWTMVTQRNVDGSLGSPLSLVEVFFTGILLRPSMFTEVASSGANKMVVQKQISPK